MILLENNSIWTLNHFLFGLTYAIISSLIFLFIVLILFKPKVRISDFLCHYKKDHNDGFYVFKFVNVSFFPAHDIRVELHKIRKIPAGGGKFNNQYHKLTLLNGDIFHIPRRCFFWEKDDSYPHCITVRSFENVREILDEDMNGIVIRVSLKHGLTGLSKVFEKEYAHIHDIKDGTFKPGTKFVLV